MRLRAGLLVLLLAAALAGCGGGDDDGDDNGSTSGGGNSARPADAILADAGLQICSEAQEQIAQSTIGPGLQSGIVFAVADDCGGKTTSPNLIRVYQFSDRESVDAGAQKAQQSYPNGVVMESGALIVVVTGPQKDANAEAVGQGVRGLDGLACRDRQLAHSTTSTSQPASRLTWAATSPPTRRLSQLWWWEPSTTSRALWSRAAATIAFEGSPAAHT